MAAKEMKFRGRISAPWSIGANALFDKDKAIALFANNDSGRGGWYPIGANQMWHNGVHLTAPSNTPVRSIAPGRIVAARLVPLVRNLARDRGVL